MNEKISSFLLLFKKKKREEIDLDGFPAIQIYKMLFGIKYILEINQLPPNHPNCRCVL